MQKIIELGKKSELLKQLKAMAKIVKDNKKNCPQIQGIEYDPEEKRFIATDSKVLFVYYHELLEIDEYSLITVIGDNIKVESFNNSINYRAVINSKFNDIELANSKLKFDQPLNKKLEQFAYLCYDLDRPFNSNFIADLNCNFDICQLSRDSMTMKLIKKEDDKVKAIFILMGLYTRKRKEAETEQRKVS